MVRGTLEKTLNALLDEEADELCPAQRYERSADRVDTVSNLKQNVYKHIERWRNQAIEGVHP